MCEGALGDRSAEKYDREQLDYGAKQPLGGSVSWAEIIIRTNSEVGKIDYKPKSVASSK